MIDTPKDLTPEDVERFFDPVECALDPQGASAALRALYAAYEREKARADLCDPTQDERVKRLVELLNEPVVTHTDQWWIDARNAALRDLGRP